MSRSIDFTGQWVGHFAYGQEYGEDIAGETVQFRLFVDSFKNGQFTGRSVDLEGIGANYEIAQVKGYIDEDFISFTTEFPHLYGLNEAGNTLEDKNKQHPVVSYSGEYNTNTQTFAGQWELRMEIAPVGEYWLEDIATGTWEMRRDIQGCH
jgi:hypothetical protein